MVAYTVHPHGSINAVLVAEYWNRYCQVRTYISQVPEGLPIDDNRFARWCFPSLQQQIFISPAVVIVLDAACSQDLWNVEAVAEGVRLKVKVQGFRLDVQQPGKVPLCIENMAG